MQSVWIPIEKIQNALTDEAFIVCCVVYLLSFLFYKLFLGKISEKRHNNLKRRFLSTPIYMAISTVMAIVQFHLFSTATLDVITLKISTYVALLALFIGAIAMVKLSQIVIYLYLFFSNMSHGVPKLIANMFTFAFTLIIGNLIASSIFGLHLGALLATSAVFSLVLGLALQDTLGNLFSGISLQIESPFQIGDWIEVHSSEQKWLGQVQEISWRATFLLSFSDELIMIPNRTIGQSQIIIISQGNKNIRLNQSFRFSYDIDIDHAKRAIREGIALVEGIMQDPPVRILIVENNPSFLEIKVFYSLVDFSLRYRKGDEIITKILESIKKNNLKIQSPTIEIISDK